MGMEEIVPLVISSTLWGDLWNFKEIPEAHRRGNCAKVNWPVSDLPGLKAFYASDSEAVVRTAVLGFLRGTKLALLVLFFLTVSKIDITKDNSTICWKIRCIQQYRKVKICWCGQSAGKVRKKICENPQRLYVGKSEDRKRFVRRRRI